ncbi:S-adenosyl-L-methionine-dependent methyltransferase [Amylocarpus encephaloides]|uniref:S-adenosyl-L-methionine-dependent methyltransferase n=1 Tax=Amylocarpus encephaloides TaxID=45428 RepID=A0A9P7YS06_9HELO|nr:S-adenosyl-L-methionine-dependent methyltransferase [Amylocarpus encephaloides]
MNITEVIASLKSIANSPASLREDERKELLASFDTLRVKLETPFESSLRFVFAPHQSVALEIAVDMKLFDASAALSAEKKEFTLHELVARMEGDVDPSLVLRIMRFLTSMALFFEVGPQQYAALPLSHAYTTASPLSSCVVHMTSQNKIMAALPSYFRERGYLSPDDAYNGPFQYAHQTPLHCFAWLATQPRLQDAFNIMMTLPRGDTPLKWFDIYPVTTKLAVASPDDVLLVDVGGGVGHDLIAFKSSFPDLEGGLVLQELPVVVDSIPRLPTGIHVVSHDMFTTPPPATFGARAYFLSNVLHDWPDKQASIILANVKEAMAPDSVLLVSENILPDWKVPIFNASADFVMMANFAALERTEGQYREFLEGAGFELVEVWKGEGVMDGRRLLEAVLKR